MKIRALSKSRCPSFPLKVEPFEKRKVYAL
jgi:hypothetical protein